MSIIEKFCSFDLETTGVDVISDRIVTAACLDINMETGVERMNEWLVNPGVDIPKGASDVHGITTEIAQAQGMDHDTAVMEITEHIYDAWNHGAALVVFNAAYDLSMLHVLSGGAFTVRGPVIDPLVIDKGMDRYRKGKRRLLELSKHYGVEFSEDEAHAADADCRAAVHIAYKQLNGWEYPRTGTLPQDLRTLYKYQVSWKREQHESLAKYFLEKSNTVIDGDGLWPIQQQALDTVSLQQEGVNIN